jgi:hypothetical protein
LKLGFNITTNVGETSQQMNIDQSYINMIKDDSADLVIQETLALNNRKKDKKGNENGFKKDFDNIIN